MLARLVTGAHPAWLLKGGYSLEIRLHHSARATKGIDLTIPGPEPLGVPAREVGPLLRPRLQEALESDPGDWFAFVVGPPLADLDVAPMVARASRSPPNWRPAHLPLRR